MSQNLNNLSIYEIFRSCRLCGAGGGYKMPIIPSVVGFDCEDIELRQKIRECLQIEVNQDDKMPPLICELCVDKVTDFYEFMEMCRQNNTKTRLRLGLPLQHYLRDFSESDNCILGVTEPVYLEDDDNEPLSRKTNRNTKIKKEDKPMKVPKNKEQDKVSSLKRELESLTKEVSLIEKQTATSRSRSCKARRSPTPPASRETRSSGNLAVTADHDRGSSPIQIIDSEDEDSLLVVRNKRSKSNKEAMDTSNKKPRIIIKLPPKEPSPAPKSTRPGPKSSKLAPVGPKSRLPEEENISENTFPTIKTVSSLAGPKSRKSSTTPGPKSLKRPATPPGPKSSKRPASPPPSPKSSKRLAQPPGPKSSKRPASPSPGPKSTRRLASPSPGPKSSKRLVSPPPGPKSLKRLSSPLPESSKRSMSPPPGPKSSKRVSSLPGPKSSKRSLSPPPGPRSLKRTISPPTGPRSSKRTITPPPGPKSSKRTISPPPGPKSSKRSISPPPGPKSTKRTTSPPPGPKSTKRTISPPPGPKSSKRTISPPPGPKSSKRQSSPLPGPKSSKRSASPAAEQVSNQCSVCGSVFQTPQGYGKHMKSIHLVKFTANDLACNPCCEWFSSAEEVGAHHKQHRSKHKPYTCRGCLEDFKLLQAYNQHVQETSCVPWREVPDVECPECWGKFPTAALLGSHRCGGEAARPGGKCSKCKKSYQTLKNLVKHESTCSIKKKGPDPVSGVVADAEVSARLLPAQAQVRMIKCDALINKKKKCLASRVPADFDLDRKRTYPYRSRVRVKREPLAFNSMVSIDRDVTDEFYIEEDYVHWDSGTSSDSDGEYSLLNPTEKIRKVPSLTTLSLKTIFSKRCLGKVPRKLRKVRSEKFDTFFNPETEFDNVQDDVDTIISNLGEDYGNSEVKLSDKTSLGSVDDIDRFKFENSGFNKEAKSESVLVAPTTVADKENSNLNSLNIEEKGLDVINNTTKDNGSETDASSEDNTKTEAERTNNIDGKMENNLQSNGELLTTDTNSETCVAKTNGVAEIQSDVANLLENQSELINDINDLYDNKLMDELDTQIGEKSKDIEKENNILGDFVPQNDDSLRLDSISDGEFSFN